MLQINFQIHPTEAHNQLLSQCNTRTVVVQIQNVFLLNSNFKYDCTAINVVKYCETLSEGRITQEYTHTHTHHLFSQNTQHVHIVAQIARISEQTHTHTHTFCKFLALTVNNT